MKVRNNAREALSLPLKNGSDATLKADEVQDLDIDANNPRIVGMMHSRLIEEVADKASSKSASSKS